jgi:hypothetical protein
MDLAALRNQHRANPKCSWDSTWSHHENLTSDLSIVSGTPPCVSVGFPLYFPPDVENFARRRGQSVTAAWLMDAGV